MFQYIWRRVSGILLPFLLELSVVGVDVLFLFHVSDISLSFSMGGWISASRSVLFLGVSCCYSFYLWLRGDVGRLLVVFGSRGASGTSDILVSCREGISYQSDLVRLALGDPLGECVHCSFTASSRVFSCTFCLVPV